MCCTSICESAPALKANTHSNVLCACVCMQKAEAKLSDVRDGGKTAVW